MNIFTDLHHSDLYYSLHRLFEERLGHKLYRPIGYEWYHQGFWKIGDPYPTPLDTARQYLDVNQRKWDPYKNLNGGHYLEDGVYYICCPLHNYHQRAITLEKFKSMQFDIIMPSFPGHDRPYEALRNRFQPKAKLIMQMGNAGQRTHLPNVLHSNSYLSPSPQQHCLRYHQEIDPSHYYYVPPQKDTRNIYSVVNCAPYLGVFHRYRAAVPDAVWKYYGASCPDGVLMGAKGVGGKMREANVAWHLKPQGGVGHSTKGWFATGRPLVTNMSEHRKAAGDALRLFVPGVTCIDLDAGSVQENCKQIRRLLEPEVNRIWCKKVREKFEEVINYDEDEKRVKSFLERLK